MWVGVRWGASRWGWPNASQVPAIQPASKYTVTGLSKAAALLFIGHEKKADECVQMKCLRSQQSSLCTARGSPTWKPTVKGANADASWKFSPKPEAELIIASLVSKPAVPATISRQLGVHCGRAASRMGVCSSSPDTVELPAPLHSLSPGPVPRTK